MKIDLTDDEFNYLYWVIGDSLTPRPSFQQCHSAQKSLRAKVNKMREDANRIALLKDKIIETGNLLAGYQSELSHYESELKGE